MINLLLPTIPIDWDRPKKTCYSGIHVPKTCLRQVDSSATTLWTTLFPIRGYLLVLLYFYRISCI